MNVRADFQKRYVHTERVYFLLVIFFITSFLTYIHNGKVSSETRSRDLAYNSWVILTRDSDMFREVRTRDILISNSQNDAYETNAGSFYYNTGIRLTYLFQTVSIWPDINTCKVAGHCNLSDVRKHVLSVYPNLDRIPQIATSIKDKRPGDWVAQNLRPGVLSRSKIWDFDIFPMTPSTMVAFIAPYDETKTTASVDFRKLRFVTISSSPKLEFSPSFANVCLARDSENGSPSISKGGLMLTYWKVPVNGKAPGGKSVESPLTVDIRDLNAGSC